MALCGSVSLSASAVRGVAKDSARSLAGLRTVMYLESAWRGAQHRVRVTVSSLLIRWLFTADFTSAARELHAKVLVYLALAEPLEGNTMLGTVRCPQLIFEGGRNSRPRSTCRDSHLSPQARGWMGVAEKWRVFHKTKYATTIRPRNYAPGLLAQRHENLCSHKNLGVNVHRGFIQNSPKLEAAQMPFGR